MIVPEKAEAILAFRPPPKLQARNEELARKSTDGELTTSERPEYAGYVRANKFVAILRRKAREWAAMSATRIAIEFSGCGLAGRFRIKRPQR
ncbi:MAG TPA: hypothetical protein VGR78_18915 [Verrucomicrobiae bacterium]|jgi:hypothetical protein|nr:hypothetical protein [Verrucomicrobiae bacterium]